ncbi:MAG TPA: sigma 54-interacting transcriptional regulator, partial [Pyrinomonadaceae bacterium]
KGTIVLDEIAHLSTGAQAKLLRVIETREFERLGGRNTIKLDARLIALTNVDLAEAVQAGRFREDLFYRLDVIHIRVPPLRERKEDLSKLIKHFVKHYSTKHGRKLDSVSAPALALLHAYDYPGNARELGNIIERLVIVAAGKSIDEDDLPLGLSAAVQARRLKDRPRTLAEMEAAYISEILAATKGNKAECARILGISRKNLYEKIARYEL